MTMDTALWQPPKTADAMVIPVSSRAVDVAVASAKIVWLWANCTSCLREFKLKVSSSLVVTTGTDVFCRVACRERAALIARRATEWTQSINGHASSADIAALTGMAITAATAIGEDDLPAVTSAFATSKQLYPSLETTVQPPRFNVGSVVVVGSTTFPLGDTPDTSRLAVVVAPSYFSKGGKAVLQVRWLRLRKSNKSINWQAVTASMRKCCAVVSGSRRTACKLAASDFDTQPGFIVTVPETLATTEICFSGAPLLQRIDSLSNGQSQPAHCGNADAAVAAGNAFRRHLKPVEMSGPGTRTTKLRGPFLGVFPGTLPVQKTKQKVHSILLDRTQKEIERQEAEWASGKSMPPLLSLVDTPFEDISRAARSNHDAFQLLHQGSFTRLSEQCVDSHLSDDRHRRMTGSDKIVWNMLPAQMRSRGAQIVHALQLNVTGENTRDPSAAHWSSARYSIADINEQRQGAIPAMHVLPAPQELSSERSISSTVYHARPPEQPLELAPAVDDQSVDALEAGHPGTKSEDSSPTHQDSFGNPTIAAPPSDRRKRSAAESAVSPRKKAARRDNPFFVRASPSE